MNTGKIIRIDNGSTAYWQERWHTLRLIGDAEVAARRLHAVPPPSLNRQAIQPVQRREMTVLQSLAACKPFNLIRASQQVMSSNVRRSGRLAS